MAFRTPTPALVTATFALLIACGSSKPAASTSDFVRRNSCPESMVTTTKESPERMRVSGCGKTEVFVWRCANATSVPPSAGSRVPLTEADARFPSGPAGPNETGCAWSRERSEPDANWKPSGQ